MTTSERITMTRQHTTFFMGTTEAGAIITVVLQSDQWEALGSPDEFVIRVRG